MTIEPQPAAAYSGRTAWARNLQSPLRDFLRTETGSAVVLLAATLAALAWVNINASSYERVWHTRLAIELNGWGISQSLNGWVNTGLMALFFFTVGLEARREFDMGELRERRRVVIPTVSGLFGLLIPILIFIAINAGRPSVHGWGVAMATDTAFALGMLALVGPRFPDRLRGFMLTISVVDDVVSLCVIGVAYTERVVMTALFVALGIFAALLVVRAGRVTYGLVYAVLGVAAWVAVFKSGIDPVVVGLAVGLLAYAYPAARGDLERATDLFRLFREQPTAELAQSARAGLTTAISPNDRLQLLFHPWVSYVIVPIFALANAGIAIDGKFLMHAYTTPITLGIIVGYLVGKPIGVAGGAWLVTKLTRGRIRPPVGWAAVAGAGTIAGIGFTVSLLVATLAFHGEELEEAKLGVLTAALCASLLTWFLFRATARLSPARRIRALISPVEVIVDLSDAVDPALDHMRGPTDAVVTMVEYGDFECPYCGQAEPMVRALLAEYGELLRYAWRHLPLNDVHPHAQLAAEASEAAHNQSEFWAMHDLLLAHQGELTMGHLMGYAEQLGLDADRFRADLRGPAGAARVARDVDSADQSGVSGTPTFFINGQRHLGAYDIDTLSKAVRAAKARASRTAEPTPRP